MKRLLLAVLVLPALTLLSGLAGCGKETKPKFSGTLPSVTPETGSGTSEGPKTKIKTGSSTIIGKVVYDGEPPAAATLTDVMKAHADKACCVAADAKPWEMIDQTWLIGKGNGVRNVVVWLNPPEGSEFEVKEAKSDAVLDQPHCVYIPHVLTVTPGQKLLIKNSATVAHNTKLEVDERVNDKFGQSIPPNESRTHVLKPQEKPITASCDFHGWMRAKIWVLPHQLVAVTDENGNFQIDNVPDGVELSVVAWHEGAEKGGFFNGGKAGTKLKLGAGEKKELSLKVKAP